MFKHYAKRTIKKLFAIPLWIAFIIISLIAKPTAFILRLFSVPYAIVALADAVMKYMQSGINITIAQPLLIVLAMVIIFVVAPHIANWTRNIKFKLKNVALRPIVVRPKVRYKADFLYY